MKQFPLQFGNGKKNDVLHFRNVCSEVVKTTDK